MEPSSEDQFSFFALLNAQLFDLQTYLSRWKFFRNADGAKRVECCSKTVLFMISMCIVVFVTNVKMCVVSRNKIGKFWISTELKWTRYSLGEIESFLILCVFMISKLFYFQSYLLQISFIYLFSDLFLKQHLYKKMVKNK